MGIDMGMGRAPVRVVLDQPGYQAVLRLRGRFGSTIGAALVALYRSQR